MSSIDFKDIKSLIEIFNDSDWDEMDLEVGGFRLFLSNDPNASGPIGASAQAAAAVTPIANNTATSSAASPAPAEGPTSAISEVPAGMVAVRAKNLGTFYRCPKPGAPPFVEIGQSVSDDTEICLIEVMKLFTALRAGVSGTVREVCVEDAELVEAEQILFLIEPDA